MKHRLAGLSALGAFALALALVLGLGTTPGLAQRISFVIATGPTGGTYFPIGQAIAGIISHPHGVDRCDMQGVCGPNGLIASVQTSAGSVENVTDVNSGRVDSGLTQADVVREAVKGEGPFAKTGALKHLTVIAALFPEEVHVVASKASGITTIAQLRGRRVSLGDEDSGTAVTARAVLAAWRISEWRIDAHHMASDTAADALDKGKIDAFFFVGGAPVGLVSDLIARGRAVLVPIDGAGRKRLLAEDPVLSADVIPASTYAGAPATQTVSTRALWVVNDSTSNDTVYGIARALFNPANRTRLDQSHPSAKLIRLDTASANLPAPLHPGAARFYREMGKRPDGT
jgi:TRAP transporter TAXI family solute receptor